VLVAHQSKDSSGGADHNVRWVGFEQLNVVLHRFSSINDFGLDLFEELGEANEFILDLVGELTGVAEDQRAIWLGVFRKILENSKYKNGSFSHSGHCLAKSIDSQHSFRDALLLHIGGVFKTAIGDGLLQFWLKEHILETR